MRYLLFIYFIIFNKRANRRTRRAKRLRIQFMPEFVAEKTQKNFAQAKKKEIKMMPSR